MVSEGDKQMEQKWIPDVEMVEPDKWAKAAATKLANDANGVE